MEILVFPEPVPANMMELFPLRASLANSSWYDLIIISLSESAPFVINKVHSLLSSLIYQTLS